MRHDAGWLEVDAFIPDSERFEPREDDEETLYGVIEITGEMNGRYKVRWEGKDPETNKPWPQSWVPKQDCTDDLALAWKKKKREKQRRTYARQSKVEKPRTQSATRRRIDAIAFDMDSDEEMTLVDRSTMDPTDSQPKRKKRKLSEAQSSANLTSRRIDAVEVDGSSGPSDSSFNAGSAPTYQHLLNNSSLNTWDSVDVSLMPQPSLTSTFPMFDPSHPTWWGSYSGACMV